MPDGSARNIGHNVEQELSGWISAGLELGERERSSRSLMWDIGDWWNHGEAYDGRAQIVTAASWTGPTYSTCRQAGPIAAKWDVLWRQSNLTFEHFRLAGTGDEAEELIRWCLAREEGSEPCSTRELKARVKQKRRATKEADLGARQISAPAATGKLYGVIYADPPWRFEPYSRESGMDRAADNHYPTMTVEDIGALAVPAADDAVLFMWATVPMLPDAIWVMQTWGFTYRSHCIWLKDKPGTGYWFRNTHELLLVGTRGAIPAPAPGTQYLSVIEAKLGKHSAKPAAFAEMIEELFPSLPALEMFAREPRLGWDVWGNEVAA